MDNVKTPQYYIDKILKEIEFCINNLNDVMIYIYPNVPWMKISGLNRIVHDYGSIQLDIIYDTVKNNLPNLKIEIEKIIKE